MDELPEPMNRILARLEGDEAEGTIESEYQDDDGDYADASHRVPLFGLRPGT